MHSPPGREPNQLRSRKTKSYTEQPMTEKAYEGLRLEFCVTNNRSGLLAVATRTFRENGLSVTRVMTLKRQFRHLYVVVSVPTKEQNDSFNGSYFKHAMEIGNPTFVPVSDPEMGFEKIVKIAHARGVCKRQDVISMMKLERKRSVEQTDCFLRVITSIPGIDNHDANALAGAIGSIEAISKASKAFILENTDLSVDKAERIYRFFRDPSYYLGPKIN